MRKIVTTLAAMGLACLGAVIPAGTSHAAADSEAGAQATRCDTMYNEASWGDVHAYRYTDCGDHIGHSEGDDSDWGNTSGPFQNVADRASSVLNKGHSGGEDVVAFYRVTNYAHASGYGCLKTGEKYIDDLNDVRYVNRTSQDMDNSISSHRWVTASACSGFMDT
jgi:hypothetical protein